MPCGLHFESTQFALWSTTEASFTFKSNKSTYKMLEIMSSKCLHEMLCSPHYPPDVDLLENDGHLCLLGTISSQGNAVT